MSRFKLGALSSHTTSPAPADNEQISHKQANDANFVMSETRNELSSSGNPGHPVIGMPSGDAEVYAHAALNTVTKHNRPVGTSRTGPIIRQQKRRCPGHPFQELPVQLG
jgi:hypothetical protein